MSFDEGWAGWWRIVDSEVWGREALELLGPALLSLGGEDDRLRMIAILARVHARPTKRGVSFTWEGASEYDPVSGTGTAAVDKDGRLKGRIRITDGDETTFVAVRTEEPDEPVADPPSYRDKWRRRW